MSPRQERFPISTLPLALLHGVVRQTDRGDTSRCNQCSSRDTALTTYFAVKDATGISVITGSPSKGSSSRHPNNICSGS